MMYSLKPLSTGIFSSEISGAFLRISFTGGFSLLMHEEIMIRMKNEMIDFEVFILGGSVYYQDRFT